MSTIPAHYLQTFRKNIELGLQQKTSQLESCVRVETQAAKTDFYHRLGPTEAQDVTARNQDTRYVDQEHIRRAVTLVPSSWADLIDQFDKVELVTDPTSAYTQNAIAALNRRKDRHILTAALGTAYSGEKGTVPVALPAGRRIAVDYVESGAAADSGLTIAKLRRAKALFGLADIDENEPLFMAVTENQIQDLLKTTEVTSDDYNTVKALVNGTVNSFMGITFRRVSHKLVAKTGTVRHLAAWTKSGIVLAKGKDVDTKVDQLPTKNYSTQVYAAGMYGAARLDEDQAVQIDCAETA